MAEQKRGGKKTTVKTNNTKKSGSKSRDKQKDAGKTDGQQQKIENSQSLGVVLMLFGLIFALWFVVAFGSNMASSLLTFWKKILQIVSFVCNFGTALILVYFGFSRFVQKKMKVSGWQLVGWLCVFFAVGGMLHLAYCESGFSFSGLWASFKAACLGFGGGLCGFLPAYLLHFIPGVKVQYVIFWAFAILGVMLGTNMRVVDKAVSVFDRDPDKKAARVAKRDAKAAQKAMKKAEKAKQAASGADTPKQAQNGQLNMAELASNLVEDDKQQPERRDDGIVHDSKDENFLISPIITDYRSNAADDQKLGVLDIEDMAEKDAVYVGRQFKNLDDLQGLDDYDPAAADFAENGKFDEIPENNINNDINNNIEETDIEENLKESCDWAAEGILDDYDGGQDGVAEAAYTAAKSTVVAQTAVPKPTDSGESSAKTQAENNADKPKTQVVVRKVPYKLPPVSLLTGGPQGRASNSEKLKDDSLKLENVLASFNVKAKVVEVVCGPAIIRYELQPAAGVKVSKIVNLQDDIALALAAKGLRIEAPVPGKSVIGIEVAKPEVTSVYFKDVVSSKRFKESQSKLSIAFGIDINGNPVIGDLASMPHLLIAGATGSGKSVCMNTLICSLLFKAKPDEVKIIMIDPKKVELAGYNGLPHLGRPVVTDPKKAALVLKEVVNEMDRRYTVFTACGVKNFKSYNNIPDVEKMPQIVVLIDELADLMMVASRDVETHIVRLTQLARAAGIHLVIATQRPSVDVITGLIKANIPSRIAFAVSSMVDSRTILDMGGAEKLLGKGDMLYHPIGLSSPVRVQGAFLSEDEIERLVEFCSKQAAQEFIELPEEPDPEEAEEEQQGMFEDDLFADACKVIFESGQASASYLQRRFRIGYNRAARLMEDMEAMGIVSPPDGKRRKVLMTEAEFNEKFLNNNQ